MGWEKFKLIEILWVNWAYNVVPQGRKEVQWGEGEPTIF